MKNTPIHIFAKSASVTLTTGIISLIFTACTFGCGELYERWVVRVCADRLWSCPWLPKFWERLRLTVHRLETGEVLVVGKGWRWTSYYRVCVTSAFTWAVHHRLSFCHISPYPSFGSCRNDEHKSKSVWLPLSLFVLHQSYRSTHAQYYFTHYSGEVL
jgi:hypothetical protein